MNFVKSIKTFYENSGYDKLFLSVLPAFCAFICAGNTFLFDFNKGFLFLISVIFLHISIKIFDDFIDWINGNPQKRAELEQTGIRALASKCSHFLNKSSNPRFYFYISLFLFIFAIFLLGTINIWLSLLVLTFLIISGLINYHSKFYKILSKIGTEIIISILCAPVSMTILYFVCAITISNKENGVVIMEVTSEGITITPEIQSSKEFIKPIHIEQLNIDNIVIWQSSSGEIYQTQSLNKPIKIYDSLYDYLTKE